ncbi:hypothetical protein I6N96_07950 [Enterococcus sp. BWM-S5]|uniref:Uncharacterized protein n=1 Tax=Enterococcus larvae TaxID=2794352 RepID=A0ABS4CHW1_9ENTE|nr:hypothetical protein [Enterococcus larvae]MBP1046214.1 hypothetical protein [Enterococcus larvae]
MNEQGQNHTPAIPTNKFKLLFVGIFILFLISLGMNIAQALHVFDNNSTAKVLTAEDIKKSNELFKAEDYTPEKYTEFVNKEIKTKENWEKDPNAVYMNYLSQSFQSDEAGMKESYEKLQKFNDEGHYIDGEMVLLKNLEMIKSEVDSPSNQEGQGLEG